MQMEIDRNKVAGVQKLVGSTLVDKGFNIPEVLFGLAELIGRTIALHTGGTIIEKQEVLKQLTDHAEKTVRIGWIATGGNVNN